MTLSCSTWGAWILSRDLDLSRRLLKLEYRQDVSATRLLVLGVVRIMQPVHGYDVRRELLSWGVEESANIKPGSIYSALKVLHKDGLI